MATRKHGRPGQKPGAITVVLIRPEAPNTAALEQAYRIMAAGTKRN